MADGRLKEVEDDATYITQKRFQDQQLEIARQAEKKARDEAKANANGSNEALPPGGATYEPDNKKGK